METISGSLEETEEADEVRSDILQVPRYPGGYERTPTMDKFPLTDSRLEKKNAELDGGAVNRGQLFVTERASDVRADEWN